VQVDLSELLDHIDPADLDYDDWCAVGMALKHEGGSAHQWDAWSQRDTKRYKQGECARKWAGFNGSTSPVTAGTLVELAKRTGWRPQRTQRPDRAFDWNDTICAPDDELRVIDASWVEGREVAPPASWNPVQDLIDYLGALFSAEEHVGYVCEAYKPEGQDRWLPKRGNYDRTAGELIEALARSNDIGAVLGDWTPDAGAWIRFNPLDGQGVRDSNVTAFRYALIESDSMDIERQAAVYAELELPVAALVHSGKKSLHAIVRVDASSKEEYRERVNFLHEVCNKNGLEIDTQNKNPSRLSRLPGATRGGAPQFLVGLNQGKASFDEWREWIEELTDDLPDFECLADLYYELPELAPPLIDGLLRQGHKMLLSGPSKAGKSYFLLEMVIAIAEGLKLLGWQCAQGRVLYVNLELDRASCFHRLRMLYEAMGVEPANIDNIDVWHLRGKAVPMDRLAPKLIRRAVKRGYLAVIIDPIYKVITGDENAADKMAFFCNQFDRVCAELGSAVIYCHHHSKGTQGQKLARDRSSGSGVFARDPDAIVDMIELTIGADLRRTLENRIVCPVVDAWLEARGVKVDVGQDDAIVAHKYVEQVREQSPAALKADFEHLVDRAYRKARMISGWRLEGTLREFAPFDPQKIFFEHPCHRVDVDNLLENAKAAGEEPPWQAQQRDRNEAKQERKLAFKDSFQAAWTSLHSFSEEPVMLGDLAESMGTTAGALTKQIKAHTDHQVCSDGSVRPRAEAAAYELETAYEAAKDLEGFCKLADLAKEMSVTKQWARQRIKDTDSFEVVQGYVKRLPE
jgi:hypothetical protein